MMSLRVLKKIVAPNRCSNLIGLQTRFSSLFEPDYLNVGKSDIPQYPTLNVQIRAYDFPILESYHRFVNKIATQMDFDVEDSWAMPPREYKIGKYKPESTVVVSEYRLSLFERNMQLSNVSSIKYPIFLRMLQAALPEGVMLDIDNFDPAKEARRYVPDTMLLGLKAELENIGNRK